jgi:hypothetical protein
VRANPHLFGELAQAFADVEGFVTEAREGKRVSKPTARLTAKGVATSKGIALPGF